jgi:hypothetical protein
MIFIGSRLTINKVKGYNHIMSEEQKQLTNKDILASKGLVEIYDPAVGAYRQVKKEDAEKLLANLKELEKSLKG